MSVVLSDPIAGPRAKPAATIAGAQERIAGYDVARSLAMLSMLVLHWTTDWCYDPTRPAWGYFLLSALIAGRSTVTFFVLAGIGLTLMSRRAVASANPQDLAKVRKTFIYRGLFLLAVGHVSLLRFEWDILCVYGVSFILVTPLIAASNRRLLLAALGAVLGYVVLYLVLDCRQNRAGSEAYSNLWTLTGLVRHVFFDGAHSVFPYAGFAIFGMWLGRQNLRRPALNNRALLCGLAAFIFAEATSALAVSYLDIHPTTLGHQLHWRLDGRYLEDFVTTRSFPPLPLHVLATVGLAVTVIALSVRLVEAWPGRLWQPLVATGQLALSWWIIHLIVYEIDIRVDFVPRLSLFWASVRALLLFVPVIVISWLWKMAFRHGPFEWIMRKVAG
jgi:uncharacterized protein